VTKNDSVTVTSIPIGATISGTGPWTIVSEQTISTLTCNTGCTMITKYGSDELDRNFMRSSTGVLSTYYDPLTIRFLNIQPTLI